MFTFEGKKIIGIAGQAGAGKDTFYETLLKPRGYIRWQMTLHYKVFLVATGRFSYDEVFVTKPPACRQVLQDEITQVRYDWSETIWIDCFKAWMEAMETIVGINVNRVAITDMRFLVEMRGAKDIGAKILHIESKDQRSKLTESQKTHRSEMELRSPEMKEIRDAHLWNYKEKGKIYLRDRAWKILQGWDFL